MALRVLAPVEKAVGVTAAVILLLAAECSAATLASFQAGDGGWHHGTLAVGNLDNAPDLEIVVPYRNSSGQWVLDAFKYNGQRLAGFPYYAGGDEMNVSPTLFDLDGDGRQEIFFTRKNHVIALRGNGSVLWSNTVSSANYVPNGGYQTITNGFYWSNGGGFISRLPTTAVFSSQVSPPIIADLNGDGRREVITGWKIDPDPVGSFQDFCPLINDIFGSGEWGTVGETWSGGVVFFDAQTGMQRFVYHIHQLVESGLAIGRHAWNRPLGTYVLNDSDSVVAFDKSQPHGLWGKGMLHKQFGKNQRFMSGAYQMPIDIYTADLDGDGLDEVLGAGTQWGTSWQPNETILDDDGTILWRNWLPKTNFVNRFGWLNNACLIPVNPDHDNHIDVLAFTHSYELRFRYWNGVELVDHAGWPKNFYPYLPTPPVVGDVDGDGLEEIVLGTYNPANDPSDGSLLVYSLDGALKTSVPVPGGIKHIPSLADVNQDGSLDVVYRSLMGRIYVQNFGANSADRVSWATHRGNSRRDGNRGVALYPPGTPLVIQKQSGYRRTSLQWTPINGALGYTLRRAMQAGGPFAPLATVWTNITSYTDIGLQDGWQYFYEVGAMYSSNTVYSPPVAILSLLNSNLIANAGFEENDNSHWDKWYTGDIEMTNMLGSSMAYQGQRAMQIRLENKGRNGSIAQFCQYGLPDGSLWVTPGQLYSFGGWIKSGGLTQPSEQWFEWGSGKTGYNTNNRPSLPYPNYFTPHAVLGTAPSGWIYANRTFLLPPGFPNVDLRHRYTVTNNVSGSIYLDNLFFRPLPAPNSVSWTTWLPFGEQWRYYTSTPPGNWAAKDFDDSSWLLGLAKFGAGDGPTNILTRLPQRKPAYYFRTQFVAANKNVEEFLLSATCTDDYAGMLCPLTIYLNGTELISSGIHTVTGQGNETRYFDLLPFADLVVAGTNTIAVKVGNVYTAEWDDVAFDICLKVVPPRTIAPRLTMTAAARTGVSFLVQSTPGTVWRLQGCDQLANSWTTLSVFTNASGSHECTIQPGLGGPSRFYRLAPY